MVGTTPAPARGGAEERAHRSEDEHADDTDDGEDESEHDGQRHTEEHPENGEDGGEDVRVDALDDLTARESIRSDVGCGELYSECVAAQLDNTCLMLTGVPDDPLMPKASSKLRPAVSFTEETLVVSIAISSLYLLRGLPFSAGVLPISC